MIETLQELQMLADTQGGNNFVVKYRYVAPGALVFADRKFDTEENAISYAKKRNELQEGVYAHWVEELTNE